MWAMQYQNLDGVIAGLEAAWAFFDGMSQCLVTGNFPTTAMRLGPCIRCSPWAFRSTPSTGASSSARRGPATDRTSPRWKGTYLHAKERFLRASIATVWPT